MPRLGSHQSSEVAPHDAVPVALVLAVEVLWEIEISILKMSIAIEYRGRCPSWEEIRREQEGTIIVKFGEPHNAVLRALQGERTYANLSR